ncbi:MAG: DUF5615 family PIN-like protein [bacterium]|nr:DUF5615 family PIN-like protein [bacterium]
MAKFYTNENFAQPVVEVLRALGHDVLTTLESGRAGQAIPDDEVLAFAKAQERILITLNRKHFIRLHQEQPDHAGIIVCTVDPDFTALAERIDEAVSQNTDLASHLIRINRPNL